MESSHVMTEAPSAQQPAMPRLIIISITANSTLSTEATLLTSFAVKRGAALKAALTPLYIVDYYRVTTVEEWLDKYEEKHFAMITTGSRVIIIDNQQGKGLERRRFADDLVTLMNNGGCCLFVLAAPNVSDASRHTTPLFSSMSPNWRFADEFTNAVKVELAQPLLTQKLRYRGLLRSYETPANMLKDVSQKTRIYQLCGQKELYSCAITTNKTLVGSMIYIGDNGYDQKLRQLPWETSNFIIAMLATFSGGPPAPDGPPAPPPPPPPQLQDNAPADPATGLSLENLTQNFRDIAMVHNAITSSRPHVGHELDTEEAEAEDEDADEPIETAKPAAKPAPKSKGKGKATQRAGEQSNDVTGSRPHVGDELGAEEVTKKTRKRKAKETGADEGGEDAKKAKKAKKGDEEKGGEEDGQEKGEGSGPSRLVTAEEWEDYVVWWAANKHLHQN